MNVLVTYVTLVLAVSDWAERMPTKRNIDLSFQLLRFAHIIWLAGRPRWV